jgi:2,3-diketo-5-methylthio-1-phosphopentane phosphatase
MRTEVFVDFDGTITDLDTFDVLVREYAGDAAWNAFEVGLDDHNLTIREVLAAEAALVRVPFETGAALLDERVAVDPTFADFAAFCTRHAIPLTIVSSGAASIIERRLRRIGIADATIVANEIDASDYERGWKFVFRDDSENANDKAALVRAAKARGSATIFVGDGRSDYAAALEADRRFVKRDRFLERYLRELGVPFESFDRFGDILAALERAA